VAVTRRAPNISADSPFRPVRIRVPTDAPDIGRPFTFFLPSHGLLRPAPRQFSPPQNRPGRCRNTDRARPSGLSAHLVFRHRRVPATTARDTRVHCAN
jgi:hypothetical protein